MANRFLSNIKINDAYTFPASDGTNGQVITTDGAGNLSFQDASASGATLIYKDTFTGDSTTVEFTMAQITDNEVKTQVYFDGVYQSKDNYSINGAVITFSTAPPSGAAIEVITFATLTAGEDFNQKLSFYGKATEAITKGDAVMFAGVQGDHFLISKAVPATINQFPEYMLGLAAQDLNNNDFGYVTQFGRLNAMNTTAYTSGDILWFASGGAVNGALTTVEPTAPNAKVQMAAVVRSHIEEGVIFVRPDIMHRLGDNNDVNISSVADKDMLVWDAVDSRWENTKTLGNITTGNITTSGTVDGVDVSSFKSDYDAHNHDGRYYTETEVDTFLTNKTNWDTAYGWGDHSIVGYLTSYTETDPIYTASSWYTTTNNSTNWNTAYGYSQTGHLPLTGGTLTGSLNISDTGTSSSIVITSDSIGNGAIDLIKNTNGTGIRITNNGVGSGIVTFNNSTGTGITIANTSTGKGLLIDNSLSTTGDPFVYTLGGAAYVKAKIDYIGNLTLAGTITASGYNNTNWDTAYGWGDHSTQSYATQTYVGDAIAELVDSAPTTLNTLNELALALGDDPNFATTVSTSIGLKWTQDNTKISNWDTAYSWGNHASAGYLTSFTETDPIYTASSWYTTTNNSTNWNTAYGWGNHASAGYLTSFTETDPVYTASSWYTTTNNSTNWNTAYGWGNHASAGYLTSFTESDPVYTSERDSLLFNKMVHATLLFSNLSDYNRPSGYSTMIQPGSYQNPIGTHGYYHIIARRDAGGGYGALLQSFNGHEIYHGNTTESTSNINWYKIWTSGDFSSTNVSNWNTAYGWGNHAAAGYLTSLPSHTHDDRYLPIGGGWYGVNLPGSRWGGYAINGGEIVFGRDIPNTSQMSILVDGAYLAGENNGFWSLPSDNNWNGRRGMYWDGTYLNFTANTPPALFSDLRAPIFYDSNNTAYYVDPTNNSSIYQAISFGDSTRYSAVSTTINGSGAGDKLILYGNTSNYDARVLVGTDYDFIFKSQGSPANKGMFRFYSGNNATLAMEIGADQVISAPNSSMRAPIFYDSNDTSRYIDPNGTSVLGGTRFYPTLATGRGSYSEANANIILEATSNTPSGYANIEFLSNFNYPSDGAAITYYTGIDGGEASQLRIRLNNDYNDGIALWGGYIDFNCKTIDGASQGRRNPIFKWMDYDSQIMGLDNSGNLTSTGSMRAPIFYDSNNTNYFLNPAETSEVSTIFAKSCASSPYSGNYAQYSYYGFSTCNASGESVCGGGANIGVYNSSCYANYKPNGFNVDAYIAAFYEYVRINPGLLEICSGLTGEGISWNSGDGHLCIGGTLYQNCFSDCRYKTNITPIESALDKIDAISGVEFDWNELGNDEINRQGHEVGVIAQDVQSVFPIAVREVSKEKSDKVVTGLVVDYDKLIPLLVQSIKELKARIEILENGNN